MTLQALEKLLRGSREKRILADGLNTLPEFGACKGLGRAHVPRLLQLLIARRMLREDCLPGSHGGFSSRMYPGAAVGIPWGVGEVATTAGGQQAGAAAQSRPFSVMSAPLPRSVLMRVRGTLGPMDRYRQARQKPQMSTAKDGSGGGEVDDVSDDDDDDDDSDTDADGVDAVAAAAACEPCNNAPPLPLCELEREAFFSQSSASAEAFERSAPVQLMPCCHVCCCVCALLEQELLMTSCLTERARCV